MTTLSGRTASIFFTLCETLRSLETAVLICVTSDVETDLANGPLTSPDRAPEVENISNRPQTIPAARGARIIFELYSCLSSIFHRAHASSRALASASRFAGLFGSPDRINPWPAPL